MASPQNLERAISRELTPVVSRSRPAPRPTPRRPFPTGPVLKVLTLLALVLTPVAAGLTAVSWAPPAQVHDVGLDGLSAQVDLRIGSNTVQIDSGLLGGLRRPGPVVLGKHVGLDVRPNDLDLTLFSSTGT
ncbi:MAG TPA: hypothetical protein VGX49_10125, partial [Jatrophihabitans sp.]|nr:hypothetical protein [Jatrophihabitans sp.]